MTDVPDSDHSTDSSDRDESGSEAQRLCPVCGREYDHMRVEEPDDYHILRDDFSQCRVKIDKDHLMNKTYEVFVHAD